MPADIAVSLKDWSTTAASNAPAGSTAISNNLDDNLRQIQAVVRTLASSSSIASASTTDLGSVDAAFVTVTGTTTITSFGTLSAGLYKCLIFGGALTLTHNATSLILPTAANITTAAGDVAWMLSLGSGNWRCVSYEPANGRPLAMPALASGLFLTNNGTALQWAAPNPSIAVSPKSSAYTIVAGDRGSLISASGTWTLALTAAATLGAGWSCYVENSGTGAITLSSASSVDGVSGGFILYPGEQRVLICDGTNFETLLIRGGTFSQSTPGVVSFQAPPGVPANGFHIRAVSAGVPGSGNGIVAGPGGRGGIGLEFRVSMTAGTTYSGQVGDGAGTSVANRSTYLTGVFDINEGSSAFSTGANPNVEGVYLGGVGATAGGGNNFGHSVYGGGGGAAGDGAGSGGTSVFAGNGGGAASVGASPGGGGGGGNTSGTVGQRGGHGLLVISW